MKVIKKSVAVKELTKSPIIRLNIKVQVTGLFRETP